MAPFTTTDKTSGVASPTIDAGASAKLLADAQPAKPEPHSAAFYPGLGAAYALPTAFSSMARQLGHSPYIGMLSPAEAEWAGTSSFKRGIGLMRQPDFSVFNKDGGWNPLAKEGAVGLAKGAGMALSAWAVEYTLDKTLFKNTPEGPVSSAVRWALVPFALQLTDYPLLATGGAIALDVGARFLDKATNGKL